ncbi:hypothetical protein [Niallia endozanthoxylica]|uniref:DUF5348 domain-containing protein n=1 Tax=Niallia endozanthoxylica TaxID=2036016 RepID=A0A5J5H292_9BACI|nr:hypothetical protein [Niallia endozanthoxylica]KAA9013812.1 hypothetical protein F4V44_24410 [Niallia endozanthoxylica]
MNHQRKYLWYYKDYGCWIKVEGDYARAMNPGESFNLRLDKELSVPCHLKLAEQQLWYVEIGLNQVKLNLRMNEVYEIEN